MKYPGIRFALWLGQLRYIWRYNISTHLVHEADEMVARHVTWCPKNPFETLADIQRVGSGIDAETCNAAKAHAVLITQTDFASENRDYAIRG